MKKNMWGGYITPYKCKNIFVDIYKYITKDQIKEYKKVVITSLKMRKYKNKKGFFNKMLYVLYRRKFNIISRRNSIYLRCKFGEGLKIWHENIFINENCTIGKNCQLHGNNCIGTKGGKCPKIGNNVDIGFGSTLIGDIEIADNCIIGANSLVNKSFLEEGSIIAGNPARKIR